MNEAPPHSRVLEEKLARIQSTNEQLRSDIDRPLVRVSEASERLVRYCAKTEEPLLSTAASEAPTKAKGCCTIM